MSIYDQVSTLGTMFGSKAFIGFEVKAILDFHPVKLLWLAFMSYIQRVSTNAYNESVN